jgi:hypothetical protein
LSRTHVLALSALWGNREKRTRATTELKVVGSKL